MAKMLFSGIGIVDIRNKINGTVFSKNRYGAYARTKVTPVNPQTTAQQNARANLSTWSQSWRGLTESQRQSWIDGAANFPFTDIFGNSKILSGQALYVKLNINLFNYGNAQATDCPTPVAIPSVGILSLAAAAGAGTVALTFTPTPIPADFRLVIFSTPNVTPGKSFVKNLYRAIDSLSPAATSPYALATTFTANFGAPTEGSKIFVRVAFVSMITGQFGIPREVVAIVAP